MKKRKIYVSGWIYFLDGNIQKRIIYLSLSFSYPMHKSTSLKNIFWWKYFYVSIREFSSRSERFFVSFSSFCGALWHVINKISYSMSEVEWEKHAVAWIPSSQHRLEISDTWRYLWDFIFNIQLSIIVFWICETFITLFWCFLASAFNFLLKVMWMG